MLIFFSEFWNTISPYTSNDPHAFCNLRFFLYQINSSLHMHLLFVCWISQTASLGNWLWEPSGGIWGEMDCSSQHSHAKLIVADLYESTIQLYCKKREVGEIASRAALTMNVLAVFFLAGDTQSPEKNGHLVELHWVSRTSLCSQKEHERKGLLTVFNKLVPMKWQTSNHWDYNVAVLCQTLTLFLQEKDEIRSL